MSKRGNLRWEEADLRRYAAGRGRWQTGTVFPVELDQTAGGTVYPALVGVKPAPRPPTPTGVSHAEDD